MRFSHTNIISTDWKKLSNFYIQVFNCIIIPPIRKQKGKWLEKGTGMKGAKLEGVHLKLPGYQESGPTLEIYQYYNVKKQEPVQPNQRGFGHIAFEVDNIEEVIIKIKSFGGNTFGELTVREIKDVGLLTFIYVRDCDGNLIELQNWKKINSTN